MGKKKKPKIDPRVKFFMMQKGIYLTDEEIQEAFDKFNETLQSFPYPKKVSVVQAPENIEKSKKDAKEE